MASSYGWWDGEPGSTAGIFNTESNIFWGSGQATQQHLFATVSITSAAVDAGNSPTTILRPGLVLGQITSSGLYTAYSPTATDGSQEAIGVIPTELNMLDPVTSAVANRVKTMVVAGPLKAAALPNLDRMARKQLMRKGVIFDDGYSPGNNYTGVLGMRQVTKAASYTVTAADNGTFFMASAAAVFTLPTLAAGLHFYFYNLADADMGVASAAGDDIVTDGDASADSVTFSTSSHKIGGGVLVFANDAGTKWLTIFQGAAPANVVTVAT
jgi:hypothetical protein